MRRCKGFTLIELLVVIAIIAILAAILFPVFASAKGTAQRIQCLANMKQLSLGLQMYVQDNSGVFPCVNPARAYPQDVWGSYYMGMDIPTSSAMVTYVKSHSIYAALRPFLKNGNVWVCPLDKAKPFKGVPVDSSGITLNKRWTSYAYRNQLCCLGTPAIRDTWRNYWHDFRNHPQIYWKESEFVHPTKAIVFTELGIYHDYRLKPDSDGNPCWDPNARINVAFMDGHSAAVEVGKAFMFIGYRNNPNNGGYDLNWFSKPGLRDF